MYLKKLFILFFLPSFCFAKGSYSNDLVIEWVHLVDSQVLCLDTVQYKTNLGQEFSITKFKYYISDIKLVSEGGGNAMTKDVFLVNEEEPKSKKIVISKIRKGIYTKIQFTLGIDSHRNCSGAQSGALDPIHAMFWTWNTGYIFLKLEGKSSASSAPGNIFEYHIGGFKAPTNCIQRIELNLDNPLQFAKNEDHHLTIQVNIAELLKNPVDIDFKNLPSVTDAKNAVLISNNYKDMFSIK